MQKIHPLLTLSLADSLYDIDEIAARIANNPTVDLIDSQWQTLGEILTLDSNMSDEEQSDAWMDVHEIAGQIVDPKHYPTLAKKCIWRIQNEETETELLDELNQKLGVRFFGTQSVDTQNAWEIWQALNNYQEEDEAEDEDDDEQ